MLNFSKAQLETRPYPYVLTQSALSPTDFSRLKVEFPNDEVFKKLSPIMGNRRRLASDEPDFYEFLNGSQAWTRFYEYLNSNEFVKLCFNVFSEQFGAFACKVKPEANWSLDTQYFLTQIRRKHSEAPFSWLKSTLNQFKERFSAKPEDLYLHVDLSCAHNGYTREVHTDNRNRLAAMVLYFSDEKDSGGHGGQFAMFRHKQVKDPTHYERFPKAENVETVRIEPPENNKALLFLCSNNSYHSVPIVRNATGWRKFIYVGLSSRSPKIWNQI